MHNFMQGDIMFLLISSGYHSKKACGDQSISFPTG